MHKQLTILIKVVDESAASHLMDKLYAAMREATDGIEVNAMSVGDEFQRLELIEQAHEAGRHDMLDDIFGLVDPHNIKSIEALESF